VVEQDKEVQDLVHHSQTSVRLVVAVEEVILKTVYQVDLGEEQEDRKVTALKTLEDQDHQDKEITAETLGHSVELELEEAEEARLTRAKTHLETLEHLEELGLQTTFQDQVKLGLAVAEALKVATGLTGQEDLEAAETAVNQVNRVSQIVAAAEAAAENRFKVDRVALVLSI
jgi:hypothetical protein